MQFKKPAQKSPRSSIVGAFLEDNQSVHSKASSQSASDNEDDEDKIFDAILKYLEENGAVSARQIIKELDISGKTGMNLLDQMDRNGFIGRDKDEDGRTVFKIM